MNMRSSLYLVLLFLCFEPATLHLLKEYLALNINCFTSITELFPLWMSHLTNNTDCGVCLLPVLRANRHLASQVWSFFLPRAFDFSYSEFWLFDIVVLPSYIIPCAWSLRLFWVFPYYKQSSNECLCMQVLALSQEYAVEFIPRGRISLKKQIFCPNIYCQNGKIKAILSASPCYIVTLG